MSNCDLSLSAIAEKDREADLDLLFEAGEAMVSMRHIRGLEAKFALNVDPVDVYSFAQESLMIAGLDYSVMCKCIDISYALLHFYKSEARNALTSSLLERFFDSSDEVTMDFTIFHGHMMFALSQNISPHLLRNNFWRT